MTLNLTGEACVTIIMDNSDNITIVITALDKICNAFGPSESAGFSFNKWLNNHLGSLIIHVLTPVLIVFGVALCFCSYALTCMRALMYRWIGGIVGGEKTLYVKIPLIMNRMSKWAPGNPFIDSENEMV